ncbi:MAG: hypothetical protein QOD07_1408 [Frankiaceae bacterium]|jgi:uncharacterized membrane protein|nr:hypothetical protein [Frankiaceae bacterium]
MTDTMQTIDVDVPIGTAYNQWTQFESFPQFMDGVDEVTQKTDTLTHWKISIGGVKREFDAEITEQHPDERVAWRAVSGTEHAGVVTFHKLADDKTRVALQIETHPQGLVEKAGDALGLTNANAKGDLKRFKQFIEKRGTETGAWRGDVPRS